MPRDLPGSDRRGGRFNLCWESVFETFAQHFASSDTHAPAPWPEPRLMRADGYQDFAGRYAGCSFEGGLYRVHSEGSGPRGQQLVSEGFPRFASRAVPFAYDWLGRQFALDDAQYFANLEVLPQDADHQTHVIPVDIHADKSRRRPESFLSFRQMNLTGSAGATASINSWAMPCDRCSKRLEPGRWRTV